MKKKLVESTNDLDVETLFERYDSQDSLAAARKHIQDVTDGAMDLHISDARKVTSSQLNVCLDLVEETSAEDYRRSETGWSRSKKRKEMKLPDLRYLFIASMSAPETEQSGIELAGFVSFMVTYEDGYQVIYVYEIHCRTQWRGKGFGRLLMSLVESLGAELGLSKSMLTVFRSNARAADWYHRLGYVVDEYSPPARRLRGGAVKEPTYLILSKPLDSIDHLAR
jgi:N-alpha-acetyltransferase 40